MGPRKRIQTAARHQPLRVNWIDERARLAGKTVLDVGCGGGILSEAMAQRGAKVTGIDMGEAPLAVARLHQLESGVPVEYRRITAEELAAEMPGQFDVVTCLEMLEHVPDPSSVIRACQTLVKPGGQVFFSTINRNPKAYLFAIVGAEYIMGLRLAAPTTSRNSSAPPNWVPGAAPPACRSRTSSA